MLLIYEIRSIQISRIGLLIPGRVKMQRISYIFAGIILNTSIEISLSKTSDQQLSVVHEGDYIRQ